MNMVQFGYFFALALIAMIVIVRGYPVTRQLRPGPQNNWRNQAFTVREEAGSWSENELNVGHANSAPPARYI